MHKGNVIVIILTRNKIQLSFKKISSFRKNSQSKEVVITLWTSHSNFKQCGLLPVHHSTATAAWLKKPTEKEKEIGHIILVYSICIYRRQKKIFCRYIPSIASHWCVSSTLAGFPFQLVVLFYLLQPMMFRICMNSQK